MALNCAGTLKCATAALRTLTSWTRAVAELEAFICGTWRGEGVRPIPSRQHASRGKQHAHKKFLAGKGARPLERELPRVAARVHAGEISECRGGQYRVSRTGHGRHEGEDDSRGGASRGNCHWQKRPPVAPMKSVSLAHRVLRRLTQPGQTVEQAVAHIHRPRGKRQKQRNPRWQMHAAGPCRSQRPDNGYRGRIETG
jgi:hypothetical protein